MATGPVMVQLDEMRPIRFHSVDIMAFEDLIGKGWLQALTERTEKQLVHLLWAGLRYRDDRLTPNKVSEMLDEARAQGRSVADLWDEVGRGLTAAGFLPKVVQNGGPTEPQAPPPGGTTGHETGSSA